MSTTEELLTVLAASTGDRHWMQRAQCCAEKASHEVFFPERPDHREAQAICARCPVRADCLAENLLCEDGCFGGTTPAERRRLVRSLGGRSALGAAGPAPFSMLGSGHAGGAAQMSGGTPGQRWGAAGARV